LVKQYVHDFERRIIVANSHFEEHGMAKSSGNKSTSTSRIRFIMVDAELNDGDIGPITQAIQNALRGPGTTTVQRLAPMPPAKHNPQDAEEIDSDVDAVVDGEVEVNGAATREPRQRSATKRVAPTPKVIEIDISAEPSLKSYVEKTNPQSNHKRYLAIAAWLHDHRQVDTITADHIYTCYRHLDWSTKINDFAQPLRELKHKQFFSSPENGKYSINHLGLAQAKKQGNASNGE
jgi:hypothetical protein